MVEQNIPRRGPGRPPKIRSAPPEDMAASSPAPSPPNLMAQATPSDMMAKEITASVVSPPKRRERKPFGSQSQKLARPNRPGYVRHWFNDTPGRLIQAQEAGWDFVNRDASAENGWRGEGDRDCRPVGVTDSGGALMAYLMETPEEWYKEDMAAEQARIEEVERALRRGIDDQGQPGKDGRYIPSQGIKIEHAAGTAR